MWETGIVNVSEINFLIPIFVLRVSFSKNFFFFKLNISEMKVIMLLFKVNKYLIISKNFYYDNMNCCFNEIHYFITHNLMILYNYQICKSVI